MTQPSRAVFLSYASQDAEAVRRICEALRTGGIEVWFDQSELRGGDAWDTAIRRQIKACALYHTGHFGQHARARGRVLPARMETRDRSLAPDRFRTGISLAGCYRRH
jgi:TIR domain